MDVAERWYKQAAEYGSPEAWMKMGERKEAQNDFAAAIECYAKALELGHEQATTAIERLEKETAIPVQPKQDVFFKDFHNILVNFRRQVGSGRIGKYKREVNFTAIVVKLEKMENLLKDQTPEKKIALSVFTSDMSQLKYHNRMFYKFRANRSFVKKLGAAVEVGVVHCFKAKGAPLSELINN